MKNSNQEKGQFITLRHIHTDEKTTKISKDSVHRLLLGRWQLETTTQKSLTLLDKQSYFNFFSENMFVATFYSKDKPYGEHLTYRYFLTSTFQIHYTNTSGLVTLKIEEINNQSLIISREIASKIVVITFKKIH